MDNRLSVFFFIGKKQPTRHSSRQMIYCMHAQIQATIMEPIKLGYNSFGKKNLSLSLFNPKTSRQHLCNTHKSFHQLQISKKWFKNSKSNCVIFDFVDLDIFLCNIETINNHHETLFISWNSREPRKSILEVGNGVNDNCFFSSLKFGNLFF